jgi:hypothetical protein
VGAVQVDGRSSVFGSRRTTTVLSLCLTASTALKGRARRRVADVIEPAEARAVAGYDAVALGGSEEATELGLPLQAVLVALAAAAVPHA